MARPRVELLPIFEDNYVFFLIDDEKQETVIVDPGKAAPVLKYLEDNNLRLTGILLTHHHNDHIGGLKEIHAKYPVPAFAPLKNKAQIPGGDTWVQDGERITVGGLDFDVMELPGHTLGHVAFWNPQYKWLFSGDVLFGLGCGRLFEGTPEQMYHSLQKIKKLPAETLVYCTHEYTETNMRFCQMLCNLDNSPITGDDEDLEMYENELRNKREMGLPSVPLKLAIEKKVNPFLLAHSVEQFAYLRELRNKL